MNVLLLVLVVCWQVIVIGGVPVDSVAWKSAALAGLSAADLWRLLKDAMWQALAVTDWLNRVTVCEAAARAQSSATLGAANNPVSRQRTSALNH